MAQQIRTLKAKKPSKEEPKGNGKIDWENDAEVWQSARHQKLKRVMRKSGAPTGGRRPVRDG